MLTPVVAEIPPHARRRRSIARALRAPQGARYVAYRRRHPVAPRRDDPATLSVATALVNAPARPTA